MDPVFEARLRGLKSESEILQAMTELCELYGGIKSVRVVTDRFGDTVCFVELAVPENQTRLYSALRGISYGNSFVFKIPA